jgi:bifunctional enzyme CysN/CysC
MIDFPLLRAADNWTSIDLDKTARAEHKGQKARVLWFTGLPGAGKSSIANLVEKNLHYLGRHTYLLDGEALRSGLNRDLGYTDADQVEHVRRAAETARLLVDAGLVVLVAVTSPFRSERRAARELFAPAEFVEIFVDTPLALCEARQPDLYLKARSGELRNVIGIDAPYEAPENAEIVVDGGAGSAEALARRIVEKLYGMDNREGLLGSGI